MLSPLIISFELSVNYSVSYYSRNFHRCLASVSEQQIIRPIVLVSFGETFLRVLMHENIDSFYTLTSMSVTIIGIIQISRTLRMRPTPSSRIKSWPSMSRQSTRSGLCFHRFSEYESLLDNFSHELRQSMVQMWPNKR